MRYAEARSQIRSGDLLAWSHRGWASWYDFQVQMVRVFTRSEYSHVGIAWVIGGRVFVIESVTGGVRLFPLSRLLPFYWLGSLAPWDTDAEEFALATLGAPYSKWEAIKAFLGLKLDAGRWECAKFALAVLDHMGTHLGCDATPTALVGAAQAHGAPCYLVTE